MYITGVERQIHNIAWVLFHMLSTLRDSRARVFTVCIITHSGDCTLCETAREGKTRNEQSAD